MGVCQSSSAKKPQKPTIISRSHKIAPTLNDLKSNFLYSKRLKTSFLMYNSCMIRNPQKSLTKSQKNTTFSTKKMMSQSQKDPCNIISDQDIHNIPLKGLGSASIKNKTMKNIYELYNKNPSHAFLDDNINKQSYKSSSTCKSSCLIDNSRENSI